MSKLQNFETKKVILKFFSFEENEEHTLELLEVLEVYQSTEDQKNNRKRIIEHFICNLYATYCNFRFREISHVTKYNGYVMKNGHN